MLEHMQWVELYRPKKVADCILPEALKKTFQAFVDAGEIPTCTLAGGPGIGKTTVALAMCDELEADSYKINASLNGNIDTLRNDILSYASTVSMMGGRKYVILDEADYLNASSTQPALRGFIEDFSKNCGFILTCNIKGRLIEALHSRCPVIDFKIPKSESASLAMQFMKRAIMILEKEGVTYEKPVLAAVIQKHFPDWRRCLGELQRYSAQNDKKIDSGILAQVADVSMRDLLASLKKKDFATMRKWVASNSDIDVNVVFRQIYDGAYELVEASSIPVLGLILADYQYKAAFVVDQEINLAACMTQIMMDCSFEKK